MGDVILMFRWAPNVITRSVTGGVTTEGRCYTAGFEDGGKGHEPRNAAVGAGEDRMFSPPEPPEGAWPCPHLDWGAVSRNSDFCPLGLQNERG